MLLADLDGFKMVNDSLGHDAGDQVLVEMAARMADCVRPGDTVARMGGDEFTILLEDTADPTFVETVADRLLSVVRQPTNVAGTEIRLGVSVGIAYSLAGNETAQDMVRNADVAMYAAKNQGRGRWATYDAGLHADAEAQLRCRTSSTVHSRAASSRSTTSRRFRSRRTASKAPRLSCAGIIRSSA